MPRKLSPQEVADRIHSYVFPGGISWCDVKREEHGDYVRVAFMPYHTLEVEWRKKCIPEEVRAYIEESVKAYQRRRGELFPLSQSAVNTDGTLNGSQCVKLGG